MLPVIKRSAAIVATVKQVGGTRLTLRPRATEQNPRWSDPSYSHPGLRFSHVYRILVLGMWQVQEHTHTRTHTYQANVSYCYNDTKSVRFRSVRFHLSSSVVLPIT